MATIILQSNEAGKTTLVMNLLRELRIKTLRVSDEDLEEIYLVRLIDKGIAEKGTVPLETIRKKLRR
jgi:ABC-type branched-subunit amino acid transport system ATPase component